MTSTLVRTALAALALVAVPAFHATPAAAQSAGGATGPGDVELLGRQYGTTPPAAYYELKAANPDAFTFSRAWKNRNPRLRLVRPGGPDVPPRYEMVGASGSADGGALATMSVMAPRPEGVSGTIKVPLVLGLFEDSPATPPFPADFIQAEFFDGPNSYYKTITEFYDELSGGRLQLLGETTEWRRSDLTQDEVAGGESGLGHNSQVGGFIMSVLAQTEGVDWGRYDNDGPDGIPNSGDDDGYVDVLTIMHPTFGAECIGDRSSDYVWSHKWNLQNAAGEVYVTDTDRHGTSGEKIKISDYTIQPIYACPPSGSETSTGINEIGVLAHELGHGLGLPDLYDTSGKHRGIGRWGLMASGSWGCSSSGGPERPCHMSAWSKEQLGWVDVVTLEPDTDVETFTFEPVATTGKVYRVDAADGSDDYLLLENRQPFGFDEHLLREGLLVWHVDPDVVSARWPSNTVNNNGAHMGVFLLQADGRNDLGTSGGNSGDAGDPFPGASNNRHFHAGTAPGSVSWSGAPFGLTLMDLAQGDGLRMTARLIAGMKDVTLEAEGAGEGSAFGVDGNSVAAATSFQAAPFQEVMILAGGGGEVAEGVRVGFTGWADDPALERERLFVVPTENTTLTATYGGTEVRARLTVVGEAFGVPPGEVVMTPTAIDEEGDFWFPEGTDVTLEAVANGGFAFDRWTGTTDGAANPLFLSLDAPVEVGAVFELTYGVPVATHQLYAATQQEIQLVAENRTGQVQWSLLSGAVPQGMQFHANGRITGVAYETGTFDLFLLARDASGLEATGELVLEVDPPDIGLDALAAPFIATSGALTSLEQQFLDIQGNGNGVYDLGDFRAWVLAHPDIPATAEQRAVVGALVPAVRFEPGGGR